MHRGGGERVLGKGRKNRGHSLTYVLINIQPPPEESSPSFPRPTEEQEGVNYF